MKKRILAIHFLLAMTLICIGIGGVSCQTDSTAESEPSASESSQSTKQTVQPTMIEIDCGTLGAMPSQLAFLNLSPCVVVSGTAYSYEENTWVKLDTADRLAEIYSGDWFCGVTETGELVLDEEILKETLSGEETVSSGSAGVFYNAKALQEATGERKIKSLGSNPWADCVTVLYEDGSLGLFTLGEAYAVPVTERVAEISGSYFLTETGDVYECIFSGNKETVRKKKVSQKECTQISACPSAARCIGICSDGTAEVWSNVSGELAEDFEPVESICMGYDYCAAIQTGGAVCFSSYNKETEQQVTDYFASLTKKAVKIACAYDRLAVLFEDGSILVLTLPS